MNKEVIDLLDDCDTAFATLFIGSDHGITPQAHKACKDVAIRIQAFLDHVKNQKYTHLFHIAGMFRMRAIMRPTTQEDNHLGIINRWDIYELSGAYVGKMVEYNDGKFTTFTPFVSKFTNEEVTIKKL